MTASTSAARVVRHRSVSPIGALVLAVGGHILVLGILALTAASVVGAAALVFGPAVFAAL